MSLKGSGNISRERRSIQFRLAPRTCAPCGPSARGELNEIKKSAHPKNITAPCAGRWTGAEVTVAKLAFL